MKTILMILVSVLLPMTVVAEPQVTMTELVEGARRAPSLKAWGEMEQARLGVEHIGYDVPSTPSLCDTMESVGLGCSLNEMSDLVGYLWAHGTTLFTCDDSPNNYISRHLCDPELIEFQKTDGFWNYSGEGWQADTLRNTVEKNKKLFRNGDLTAEAARMWQK